MSQSSMKQVSIKTFADIAGVSRSSVYRLIESASIFREGNGLISLTRSENRRYLKAIGVDLSSISIPEPASPGRPPVMANKPESRVQDSATLSREMLARKHTAAKISKIELDMQMKRERWLPADIALDAFEKYTGQLQAAIIRKLVIFIQDRSAEIITAGECNSEILWRAEGEVVEMLNEAKAKYSASVKALQDKIYGESEENKS